MALNFSVKIIFEVLFENQIKIILYQSILFAANFLAKCHKNYGFSHRNKIFFF